MNNTMSKNKNEQFFTRKLSPYFCAEITGIDLSQPLNDETIAAITKELTTHEVLVFPKQDLSSEDLLRIGAYFGELTVHPFAENSEEVPELIVFDYKDGNPPVLTDNWHSDETYRKCPPLGTMLYSRVVPELGGDTCFSSMTQAYNFLSPKIQQFIEGLEAVHDFTSFKYLFPETQKGREQLRISEEKYPPASHPVVRIHPVTGKKTLFVNPQYTRYIKGMENRESTELLNNLYRTTSVLEYQFRHRWEPNMLVFWDNRSVQHAAVHDYYPSPRHMERVTIIGDEPISEGETATQAQLRKFKVAQYDHLDDRRALRQFELE